MGHDIVLSLTVKSKEIDRTTPIMPHLYSPVDHGVVYMGHERKAARLLIDGISLDRVLVIMLGCFLVHSKYQIPREDTPVYLPSVRTSSDAIQNTRK